MKNRTHKAIRSTLIIFTVIVFTFLLHHCEKTVEPPPEQSDNEQILRSSTILIFGPHPDDEILGFGGIIYEALQLGKTVKVIIATNGDGYFEAAYFWKNGCPNGEPSCSGTNPTKSELESFGVFRLSESRNALSLLGLQTQNVVTFGYPDGKLRDMYNSPSTIIQGNTSRSLSHTGKQFSGVNLKEDIKIILRNYNGSAIFTTHSRDHHADHSALAAFVQLARSELKSDNISFETYWSIVHEPDADNDNSWPPPLFSWTPRRGEVLQQREQRYKPDWELQAPSTITESPLRFRMKDILWSTSLSNPPLLRRCIDSYKTQIGLIRSDGGQPIVGYEGWIDRNGYLISFVRRNHLIWKAPSPEEPSTVNGPCQQIANLYPIGTVLYGKQARGADGDFSCYSDVFQQHGIRISPWGGTGRAYYDFGPISQSSISVSFQWVDNAWFSDLKALEVYNWTTSSWERITSWSGNDGQVHNDSYQITITAERKGPGNRVRVGLYGAPSSVIHLNTISVN